MELLVLFILFFFMMLTPNCVSTQIQGQSSSYAQDHIVNEVQYFSSPNLPRKLRVLIVDERAPSISVTIQNDATDLTFAPEIPGKSYDKREKKMKQSKEWIEESQYFAMDYGHVTRRRPIHNKALPVAP